MRDAVELPLDRGGAELRHRRLDVGGRARRASAAPAAPTSSPIARERRRAPSASATAATAPRSPRSISARRTLGGGHARRRARPRRPSRPPARPGAGRPSSSAAQEALLGARWRGRTARPARRAGRPASRRRPARRSRANAASTSATRERRARGAARRQRRAATPSRRRSGAGAARRTGSATAIADLLRRGQARSASASAATLPPRALVAPTASEAAARSARSTGCDSTHMSAPLPPGPSEPPVVQTARWLLRPISFLESCRRRFGDAFSVTLPRLPDADGDALRPRGDPGALHRARAHAAARAARSRCSRSWARARCCCSRAREHLRAAQADAAAVPRRAHARLRGDGARGRRARGRQLARRRAVRAAPAHAGGHARGDPARGLRRHRRRRGRARLRRAAWRGCWPATSSAGLQFGVLLARRFGGPIRSRGCRRCGAEIDALLARGDRRAARPTRREDILSLLVAARFEDGEPMERRSEIRDQLMTLLLAGHETTATGLAWTLDLLAAPPARARAPAREPATDEAYLRAVVAESLRLRPVVPLAGRRLTEELRVDGHALPAGTDVTPAIWLAHTRADRLPGAATRSGPSASSTSAPATYALDPVRRRRAPLPRRGVRGDGDARRARRDRCGRRALRPARRAAPSASRGAT